MAEYQPAPRNERLADLRAQVEANVQLKRYYMSFAQPEQRERQLAEAARRREQAAKIIAEAERIEAACSDWKSGYIAADDRVTELRAQIVEVENEQAIERLGELMAQMQELNS